MWRIVVALTLLAGLVLPAGAATAQPNNAEQIVFSGQTPPGSFTGGPFGFWVWCEDAEAGNPYAGFCAGSIYFYALELIRPVRGTVSENPDGSYTMTVESRDGAIACELTNVPPVTKGPRNDVNVSCSSPGISGTFHGAVVQVTGPDS